ncbi:hypothetical protein LBMAG54_10700 [Nitrosopumilaceae archaeon]|nr:hypothetical protein LBMAG54_10700 [Nitrosopumilaceae archaeon]
MFGTDSITRICVTGFFPIMKNPATDEIIKTAFKSTVKNNTMLQIVIAEKQINNIALFTWYLSMTFPQKIAPIADSA